jgi:hypothetical protein
VNPATLSWWKWKLGDERAAGEETDAGAFVEITAMVGHGERITLGVGGIDVRIPDGFDEDTLGRVLAVLEGRR